MVTAALLPLLACLSVLVHAQQSVTVDNIPVPVEARPVSGHTVGLAVEWFGIDRFMLVKPWNTGNELKPSIISPVSVNAVKILQSLNSPGFKTLIRIGGNSARDMWWLPSIAGPWDPLPVRTDEVDIPQLQFLDLFAQLTGVHYQLCIGTRFPDPNSWYTRELLQAFRDYISPEHVHSIEIGNEPDHFELKDIRPEGTYSYPTFISEFRSYQSVVSEYYPNTPQAGPSYAFPWRDEGLNEQFIRDTAGSVRYNTIHRYDLRGCSDDSSLDELMTRPSFDGSSYSFFTRAVNEGNNFGAKVVWNEAGTASCGGIDGISNVFASALWTVDAAFTSGYLGVDEMLLSGAPQALYGPLTFEPNNIGWTVRPTYYGMLAFALAIPGDATVIRQFTETDSYKVWGAWDDTVQVHTMTIINKARGNGPVTVTMDVPFGYPFAKRINLEAPGGLTDRDGARLAGMYYDPATALLQGEYAEEIIDVSGATRQITVTVPQESAAIIFMSARDLGNLMAPAAAPLVGADADGKFVGSGAGAMYPLQALVLGAVIVALCL